MSGNLKAVLLASVAKTFSPTLYTIYARSFAAIWLMNGLMGFACSQPPRHLTCHPHAKRWSAVSDGGEDQGAEEVTVHGAEEEGEESSRQFWKEPSRSRERLFLFSAFLHSPACSGPWASLVHSMIVDLRPGTPSGRLSCRVRVEWREET